MVEIGFGFKIYGHAWGENVVFSTGALWAAKLEEVPPFFSVVPKGPAYHKKTMVDRYARPAYHYRAQTPLEQIEVFENYGGNYDKEPAYRGLWETPQGEYQPGIPYNYVKFDIIVNGEVVTEQEFCFERPDIGKAVVPPEGYDVQCSLDFFGLQLQWTKTLRDWKSPSGRQEQKGFANAWRLLQYYDVDKDAVWARYFEGLYACDRFPQPNLKGIKAIMNRKDVRPNLERLKTEKPLLWDFFQWLQSAKTSGGVNNNQLIGAFLKTHGSDYDSLVEGLKKAMDFGAEDKLPQPYGYSYYDDDRYDPDEYLDQTRALCLRLPEAGDQHRERLAKKDWSMRKGLAAQADGLGITKDKYPLLYAAVEAGEVPLSLFHVAGNAAQPCNSEFDLWEKAFKQPGWKEPLCEIASNAGRRSTYEKDVTPYISFLFHLPKYLDRHTEGRKKWRAMPKFVKSEWELEMDDAAEGATTKKRSALTPVADNEERVIEVPYAALSISGVRTTYCYALRYYVFEENQIDPENGTPIINELERKLNGRDDYGLMYYTLTGTAQNRGYPAFLIIFERLKRGTRVHFHRVHPCRSKNGIKTPASRLIEECYRYMAGNIRAEEIHAQQGDLIFLRNDTQKLDWEADGKPVKDFESHAFVPSNGKPVLLIENTAKSIKNRLGFLHCASPFKVDHPEHDPLTEMPAGTYEVRRCKSWEANPKAVWTLTID